MISENDTESEDMDEDDVGDVCVGCGMESDEWEGNDGKGYDKDGQPYCCKECAGGIECSCGV